MNKNNIKVLLIGTIPPPIGGDATWMQEYLEYCNETNYQTYLVKTNLLGKRAETVNDTISVLDEVKRCLRIWRDLLVGIKRFKPDIIHLNSNCSGRGIYRDFVCARIINLFKIPFVVHCHCNVGTQLGKSRGSLRCFSSVCNDAKSVLVLNSESEMFVRKYTNRRIDIVPNYIDRAFIVQQKHISDNIENVLFVGHIKKTKGVLEILEAAQKYPEIRFLLVGPITDEFMEYKLIDQSKGNIEFLGPKSGEHVREYMDMADVFLFPSYTEGFSMAMLEAMSRGMPIIATDVGANKDMIEEEGGCIIEVANINEIVSALQCMSDKNTRERMSNWNIQKVNECYTIDKVIENIWDIYREVLNETHSKSGTLDF